MISKKTQAAMDFFFTYIWALLGFIVILVLLGVFGILSPTKLRGSDCIFSQPVFTCVSHQIVQNQITLVLSSTQQRQITITQIGIGECRSSYNSEVGYNTETTFIVGTSCQNGDPGDRFKEDITLNYVEKDTGLAKTVSGYINSAVE